MAWPETLRALAAGGILWVLISAWRNYIHKRLRRSRDLFGKYGPFALVTGATGGVGSAFVELLAAQGFSIVITARSEKELSALAAHTAAKFKTQVVPIVADIATPEGQAKLISGLQGLDVGLVIHNAGVGYVGAFAQQDIERLTSLVALNCLAPIRITSMLLPSLKNRKHSGIIFLSSLAGYQPLPLHSTYSASKAFISTFAFGLREELKGYNIDVIVSEPGSIATGFAQSSGAAPGRGASPAMVAAETLSELGLSASVSPGSYVAWLRSFIPRTWAAPLGKWRQQRLLPRADRAASTK